MFVQIVSYFVFHDFFLLSFYLLFLSLCVCVCVCFMGYILSAPTYHLLSGERSQRCNQSLSRTVDGSGVRSEPGETLSLVEHGQRHAVQSLRDELDCETARAVPQRQRLRDAVDRVQDATTIDRVQRRHVRQVRHEKFEHLYTQQSRQVRSDQLEHLYMQPFVAYVVTLPCETLMSAKQAINDILQGSVATYSRCGGVVNNQIEQGLLLSLRVKIF